MANTIIMGAAGRDFHDFNVCFRDRPEDRVVAFTASQIPNISERVYPPELAGNLYPRGIPIYDEERLPDLIREFAVGQVVFAYSDISYVELMHKASLVLAAGASFTLLGPNATMLTSSRPVLSVCAVRTGAGKGPVVRRAARALKARGLATCVVRHPMPYGDLRDQVCQRFATAEDLDRGACTIEEREEYEPHIREGTVVFAGVDYARVLAQAEAEADVIIWDGGNNDLPFFRPTLHVVLADALRPGHELAYHPGETNARLADAFIVTKVDAAAPEDVALVRRNLAELNPAASLSEAALKLSVSDPEVLPGARVLVIEDGPTITHGGMPHGAGLRAVRAAGAEVIDPRPYAVGSIKQAYAKYPHIGPVLPALGYGEEQLHELAATIAAVPADVIVIASPVDLRRLLKLHLPSVRVTYEAEVLKGPTIEELVAPLCREPGGKA